MICLRCKKSFRQGQLTVQVARFEVKYPHGDVFSALNKYVHLECPPETPPKASSYPKEETPHEL